jgi:hypothetical protein
MMVASIPGRKVGEECWNSSLDGRLEAVAASIQLKAVAASIQLEVVVAATSEVAATDLWLKRNMSFKFSNQRNHPPPPHPSHLSCPPTSSPRCAMWKLKPGTESLQKQ